MEKARTIVLYILALAMPLLFLPGLFADAFGLPKFLLLLIGVSVLLLIWGYKVFLAGEIKYTSSKFDLPVLILGFSYFLSTMFASPNKVAALTSPSGSGVIILLVLFYFLSIQTSPQSKMPNVKGKILLRGLVHAGIILSLWIIVNLVLELANISYLVENVIQFPAAGVSPTGNLLMQAGFLLILLVFLAQRVASNLTNLTKLSNLQTVQSAVILIGLLATTYKLSQLFPFPLLPYQHGWAIAVDSFKNAPIFGSGPASFSSAFTRYKPISINQTDYWNIAFGFSSNYYLHIFTTTGLLGLGAYLFLAQRVLNCFKNLTGSPSAKRIAATLGAIFVLQFFIPFNIVLLFAMFSFLAVLGEKMKKSSAIVRLIAEKEDEL